MKYQLIVIDSRVRSQQFVVDQIAAGYQVLVLDADKDGLGQIADYLSSRSSADGADAIGAVHLLSHGSAGEVKLGSLTLDSANLASEAQTLARIHSLLSPGADLLLYGCDVAQGAQGNAFVTQLAKVSGLDVAASSNLTGGTKGDWVLETTVGQLQAQALHLILQDSLLAGQTINGTSGNDTLNGTAGNDTINGLGGDDWIDVGNSTFGSDAVDGGSGADWISFSKLSSVSLKVNLADHTATSTLGSVTLTSIEKAAGTSGADSLTGGDVADKTDAIGNRVTEWFRGNGGNDTITGGAGRDFAAASDYSNNSSSQAVSANLGTGVASDGLGGTDTLINIDFLVGGAGNDSLTGGSVSRDPLGNFHEIFRGNAGNDTLDGSNSTSDGDYASSDRADYSRNSATQAVIVNLSAQSLTVGSKTVAAGKADDGMGGTDTLISIDQVYGGAGNDTFVGGSGGQTFDGGAGNDSIDGGAGSDQVRYQQSTAGVIVNLSASSLTAGGKTVAAGRADDGMGGTDTLVNIENVRGSDYNDYIRGSDDTSTLQYLSGDAGSDTIDGGLGIDIAGYGDTPLSLGGITASLVAGQDGVVRVTDRKGGTDTLMNIEGLSGTHSADSLTGSSGNDYLRGQGGSDMLDGGAGNDWVLYSADPSSVTINLQTGQATDGWNGAAGLLALGGTDTLKNIENAEGSDFNDSITGSDGDNQLVGRAGNDSLLGGGGRDTLDGGLGNDTLDGGTITDTLNLDDLNIASYASATGAVVVNLDTGTSSGAAGNDVLRNINMVIGSTAADTLTGSNRTEFAELFEGGAGDDTIDGLGGNFDVALYMYATAAVTVNLATGIATGNSTGKDTLRNIEAVFGSSYSDSLTGGSNSSMTSELFRGDGGNDTIDGGSGYDWAFYDTGATGVVVTLGDTVDGSASDGQGGTDVLRSIEGVRGSAFGDTLTGSNRTDATELFEGREGNDVIDGKGGLDTAWYKNSRSGVDVDLSQGKAIKDGYGTSDTLTNIENVYGSRDFNDLIKGNAGDNRLEGNGGNDTLMGGAGEDFIIGGTGNDSIDGGTNVSPYFYDWASYEAATGAVQLNLRSGQSSGADGIDTLTGIEAVSGSSFADTLIGDANTNIFLGNRGNDTIDGGDGFDVVDYSLASGSVTVSLLSNSSTGADGEDTFIRIEGIQGSKNNDTLTGDANDNWIGGNAGADSLVGGAGIDTANYHRATGGVTVNLATGRANGADGNDTLDGFENIAGSLFYADSLTGNDGNNWIEGNGGNDTLVGAGGNDTLLGGDGQDYVEGGLGDDVLDGGANDTVLGFDWVGYQNAAGAVQVNLSTGLATGADGNDTLTSFDAAAGGGFADSLTGDANMNVLRGNGGDDTLDGGAGFDHADYSRATGSVTVSLVSNTSSGFDGADTLISIEGIRGGQAGDKLTGDAKDNWIRGNGGDDTLDGGAGIDTADYYLATGGVTVSLGNGTSSGADGSDTLAGFENVRGSFLYDDSLVGDSGNNKIEGMGGNDTLIGGAGQDFLIGGTGDDSIDGGTNDTSLGSDWAGYEAASGAVQVNLSSGRAAGADGNDTLAGIEAVAGSAFADTLTGDTNNNVLRGNGGNDTIDGGTGFDWADYSQATGSVTVSLVSNTSSGFDGNDTLTGIEAIRGGKGNDTLTGNANNNWIRGNGGDDVMDGGAGVDTADYYLATGGVTVSLATATSAGVASGADGNDTLSNFENINGSFLYNDNLTGNDDNNSIQGLGGDDTLNGGAGIDNLMGGDGNDVITVTDTGSTDSIDGGAGWDNLTLRMGTGTLTLNGGNILGIESYNLDVSTIAGTTAPTVTVRDTVFAAATTNTVSVSAWGANAALNVDASAAAVGHNVNLNGGNGKDTLVGGSGDDTLWGGTGDDNLTGGAGNDTANYNFGQTQLSNLSISASNGTWTLNSGTTALLKLQATSSGVWTVTDLRTTSAAVASNSGMSGIDTLTGIETIHLDVRDSIGSSVSLANMDLRINGGIPSVTLRDVSTLGTTGNDALTGTSGNDIISAFTGADTITALGGDDQITLTDNGSTDSIDGGVGYDTLSLLLDGTALNLGANANIKGIENFNLYGIYTGNAAQAVNLSDALFSTTTGTTVSVNTWTTSATLNVNASTVQAGHSVKLYGSIGNDTLIGGAGDDFLNGGSGSDSLVGGDGNDTLTGYGTSSTLDLGAGFDTWVGDVGQNRVDNSTLVGNSSTGWNFVLGNGTVIGLIKPIVGTGAWTLRPTGSSVFSTFSNIELVQINGLDANGAPTLLNIAVNNSLTAPMLTIIGTTRQGSQGNDSLLGTSGNDTIYGQGGDDTIDGAAGNDLLLGGDGRDALIGGAGNDTLDGGYGRDTVYYGSAPQGVTVNLVTWYGAVDGTASDGQGGTDVLRSLEHVIGSAYADDLTVGRFGAADGGAGNDVLRSGNGTALLYGGAGNDAIVGSVDVDVAGFTLGSSRVDGLTVSGSAAVGWTVSAQGVNLMGLTYNSMTSKWTASDLRTGSTTNSSFGTDTLQSVEYLQLDGTGTNGTNSAFLKLTSGASPTVGVASVITNSSTYVGWGGQNMTGSNADDLMYGGDDNDTLIGGNGNDVLLGGYGGDRFIGGAGDDTLSGGYQTNVSWRFGRGNNFNDWDTADYTGTTTAGIRLDLYTMKAMGLAGANTGTDTLRGIEQLSMTRQHDEVVGTLATLSGNNELGGDQHELSIVGYGGSDSFSDTLHTNTPWQDMDIEYWWSKTAISVMLTGSTGTVSYGAAGTLGSADYQAAGVDTLSRISEFGDSNFSDTFNFTNQTENAAVGQKWAWVHLSLGNDTVVGNGETSVSFSPWGNMQSSTGKGIYVQLGAPGVTTTVNLTHLTLNATAMGTATLTDVNGVTGTNFDDTLMGSAGNDHLDGRGGNDLLDGGAGWDKANYLYSSTTGIAVNMQAGTVSGRDTADTSVGYDTLRSIEMVQGTNLDDVYDARGFSGTSTNAGSDGLWNQFQGNGGNDTIYGNGTTSISYGFSSAAVDVNLSTGQAKALDPANQTGQLAQIVGNDSFTGVYQVVGSVLGDLLTGNGDANKLQGGAGNDTIAGLSGADTLEGGDGNDTLDGGDGADSISGGDGNDTLDGGDGADSVSGGDGNDLLTGGKGNDTLDGGAGTDTASYASASAAVTVNLAATTTNGTASSTAANDAAAIGTDTLKNLENVTGSSFGDKLTGDGNANVLNGSGGNDTLYGKLGKDTLTGGAGADIFVLDTATGAANVDTITDFTSASDKIQLSKAIFTQAGSLGNLATDARFWSVNGSGVVAGHDADDRFVYNTTTGNLYYDADGSGTGTAVLIATLGTATTHPTLAYSDLQIIG
jgi:Ca2+-binding RTX toxin-like protein